MSSVVNSDAPFDLVLLETAGLRRRLTPNEFFALPLSERIRHVIERTATFMKDGREVDRQTALSRLRVQRAAS